MKSNYEILGLPENAQLKDVEAKYGALLRQYKQRVDEKGATYEDLEYYRTITHAYDEITGKVHDLSDENPTSIVPYKIRKRLEIIDANLRHYYFGIFIVVIMISLGILFYFQYKDNRKTDFTLKFVGAFSVLDPMKFSDEVADKTDVFDYPLVSFFTVTTDTQFSPDVYRESDAFFAQLRVGRVLDVILLDKESYDIYVKQAAFLPLDDILEEYKDSSWYDSLILYEFIPDPNKQEEQPPKAIYGIDITDAGFFDDTSLEWLHDTDKGQEKRMILTIARTSKRKNKAIEFMEELLNTLPQK